MLVYLNTLIDDSFCCRHVHVHSRYHAEGYFRVKNFFVLGGNYTILELDFEVLCHARLRVYSTDCYLVLSKEVDKAAA